MNPFDAIISADPTRGIPQRSFVDFCAWAGTPLTAGQAAFARVAFDGHDPTTETERELFGGMFHVPPEARRELVCRFGRDSGKSFMCGGLYGVFRMMTGDVSACGPGDDAMAIVVSTDTNQAKSCLRKALAVVRGNATLRACLVRHTATEFVLRRPHDGRETTFSIRAKSVGGRTARGYSILLFVLDEAEHVGSSRGAQAAINTDEITRAARPRILAGGTLIMCSTPWPAESAMSKAFDANWANPSTSLAARGSTLLLRDGDAEIAAARAVEMAKDPANALREYDCVMSDAEGLFFEASTIDAAQDARLDPAHHPARRVNGTSGVDFGFQADASGHVITERWHSWRAPDDSDAPADVLAVVHVDLVPAPMMPSQVASHFVEDARDHNVTTLVGDGHYILVGREHAIAAGMTMVAGPSVSGDKDAAALYLRDLFRERRVKIPPNTALVAQLKSALAVALPGGRLTMVLPRRKGAGHADLVPALVNAAWHDRRHGPIFLGPGVVATTPETFAGGWSTNSWGDP